MIPIHVQSFRLAMRGILTNRMRSILTMLGVIIGVASVVTLVSVGNGVKDYISGKIEGMGSNLIIVNLRSKTGNALTLKESLDLANRNGIDRVAPAVSGEIIIKAEGKKVQTMYEGTTEDYSIVRNHPILEGRFISSFDISYGQKVVVLGKVVHQELSNGHSMLGQMVKINGFDFKVIGILAEKGQNIMVNPDDKILLPITTAGRVMGNKLIRNLYIQAKNPDTVKTTIQALNRTLSKKFRDENSFSVINQQDLLSTFSTVSKTLTLFLSAIASISLLVGGIGIMNIMLVSVTERTREIGIRKACGAKRANILSQFLVEAMVLSGFGGLIGMVLGALATIVISRFIQIAPYFSLSVMLLSLLFSLAVGVIFGMYPAYRASYLNPIEALRFE
jgi:putative ABC transport system permease protein